MLGNWLFGQQIPEKYQLNDKQVEIVKRLLEMNFDFAKEIKLNDTKLGCYLEIIMYLLKKLLDERISEGNSFQIFKELLLRHSVQRPSHSLCIFNLDDLK